MPRHRDTWTDERLAEVARMRREGLTYREIAERYGISVQMVGRLFAVDPYRERMAEAMREVRT